MAWYAIGDIQGCYLQLTELLKKIDYKPGLDQLWLCGDLVNRGPQSADVLRWAQDQGPTLKTVLGNHDLHLLSIAYGVRSPGPRDTVIDVIDAVDAAELLAWVQQQPLILHDQTNTTAMVHAGLVPPWNINQAKLLANEVSAVITSDQLEPFLNKMYGDRPKRWSKRLRGWKRLRFITNVFTRLRFCSRGGKLLLEAKGRPGATNKRMLPWFLHPKRKSMDTRIIFGHWSTLGIQKQANTISLDSGCLWGGRLTAVRLDSASPIFYSVSCPTGQTP